MTKGIAAQWMAQQIEAIMPTQSLHSPDVPGSS